ncbi:hypothetical protein LCGC14_0085090 [marine sediment metagenome]|uniref:Uncharacterized protein n=2 Tax=root TaxID=1 RepID=A0A9C9NIQ5_9HYPH|nr:hypothetical protein [Aurantimonas coralicida]
MTKEILESHVTGTMQAAIDDVMESAAALTDAVNAAADLGMRVELEIVPLSCTIHRKVVAHVAHPDEGRRPEDLNSANDG